MAQDTLLGFPAHTLPYRRGEFTTLSTVSLIVCYHIFCLRAIKFCFRAVFLRFVHFALAFPLFLWYTLVCYELSNGKIT